MKDCELKELSPPAAPAAVAMEEEEAAHHLLISERENSPSLNGAVSQEPPAAMLTVEVAVDEVEPHHVQVPYNQVGV